MLNSDKMLSKRIKVLKRAIYTMTRDKKIRAEKDKSVGKYNMKLIINRDRKNYILGKWNKLKIDKMVVQQLIEVLRK